MSNIHYRTCNLCEAACGLKITYSENSILKIEGDSQDLFSRGHICPKANGLKDIYNDPDRLKYPLKRVGETWIELSWEEAFDLVVSKTKDIQSKYGSNSIGIYQGNPSVHNLGTMLFAGDFFKKLKTQNNYSATSTDQLPHHFASEFLYGHPLLIPIPDIDNTHFMLIIGGNPLVSNGSMMTVPDVGNRLKAIQNRGGKVVVVDPRKTETAIKSDKHIFIKPGSDVLFLIGMIKIMFAESLIDISKIPDYVENVTGLKDFIGGFNLESIEKHTGIALSEIYEITKEFCNSKTAVCYGRMGLSTQEFGGLGLWLMNVINIVSNNFDKKGGVLFTLPAIDFVGISKPKARYNRWQSRLRKFPEFIGELPVSCLAEEIETPGENQVKMLFTSCGNPVLSTPNGKSLEKAFDKLEFMVSIDIYLNETTKHADLILPPATGLETSHYDLTFYNLSVRNVSKYSPALFEKDANCKYDYEIFQELAFRYEGLSDGIILKPEDKLKLGLQYGPYQIDFEDLKLKPHGIDLGPLNAQCPARLKTKNKTIDLAPEIFIGQTENLNKYFIESESSKKEFYIIGRRHLRDNNSWMHNSEKLQKGKNRCVLMMNPKDADEIGIVDNQMVRVRSRVGEVDVNCILTNEMMSGVVSLPHGYGHGRTHTRLSVANRNPGVSLNDLTDDLVFDKLTGNSAFSNVKVCIEPILN
jgi:anaerobic selenocysteine-containing dehydrogenase